MNPSAGSHSASGGDIRPGNCGLVGEAWKDDDAAQCSAGWSPTCVTKVLRAHTMRKSKAGSPGCGAGGLIRRATRVHACMAAMDYRLGRLEAVCDPLGLGVQPFIDVGIVAPGVGEELLSDLIGLFQEGAELLV